jgi:5'(3')-deoxyribonucleotidase
MDDLSFKHVATALGTVLASVLTGWVAWINTKVADMYSKEETTRMIELKGEAMRQSIDTNSRVTERLVHTLDRLEDVLNRLTLDVELMKSKHK